ncbi:Utp14-domain-containing protein [Roridomyces roridus]|uniref:Utp14-domain-containing protein n=1 Tax=Roridomyces roridus TaxID=1738132 RepID=A0AAD7C4I7_9AGAR|nr:Utp14-domain-containing protein [Roridomyces roridus]
MARSTSSKKAPQARAKANAAGYLKRHSSKPKTVTPTIDDVYELVENDAGRRRKGKGKKPRRETVELEYDYGEDGARDDLEEDSDREQPRLFGEGDEIASEDDEEIDSDGAFEDIDGDADGFAGVFSRKQTSARPKRAVRFADVDLNEDEDSGEAQAEEDEEDLNSDIYIDILDVLDGKGEVYHEDEDSDTEPVKKPPIPLRDPVPTPHDDEEMESADEESESADEDEEMPDQDDEIDTSPEALTALHAFINGLPADAPSSSAKRKAPDASGDDAPRKKRALSALKERTQVGAEGEFQVGAGQKLALADLLAPLSSAEPDALRSVEQSLGVDTAMVRPKTTGKKVKAVSGGALAVPLPLRAQDRVDREAAYEATKEEVRKWDDTMKRIREAEHLSFPLQAPKDQMGRVSNAQLTAKFKPTTELESAVSRLLTTANLAQDTDIQRTENTLMAAKLSPEEVARRRNELRQMRELAFRGEIKARRVAKIKSKTYRKIARGKKERRETDDGDDEEGATQREVNRARERAGMRIKRNAKWNRSRVEGEEDEEIGTREEIENELERKERLTRLIRGDKDDGSSDEDESGGEEDEEAIKRSAFDELKALKGDGETTQVKQKGVFGMKFMQDALKRRDTEANEVVDDFIKEMAGEAEEDDGVVPGVITQRTGGRVSHRPGEETESKKPNPTPTADREHSPPPPPAESKRPSRPLLSSSSAPAAEQNPWLVPTSSSSGPKAPRTKNDVIVSKDSKSMDKARHKLAKNEKKLDVVASARAQDDEIVEIQMGKTLGDEDDDADSEVDAQEQALKTQAKGKKADVKAFEQRDLVALAFAGDNVVRDFEQTKQREIASDAPREVDTSLAGWGSWGGPSTTKRKPKPQFIKKIPGVAPADRADHNKAHIIISEKRDKKAAKYQVKDLPYPYTSRAQYERSMETPIGTEWNTRVAFQRGTLPKVIKKMGVVIEPLEKLA